MPTPDLPFKMRASRTLTFNTLPEMRRHIQHVGEITFAWTQLHSALFAIFNSLFHQDGGAAYGIWHCIRNDSAQRDMLLAAAEARLTNKKTLLNQVRWIARCAEVLGGLRNDLAHTGIAVDVDLDDLTLFLRPDPGARAASIARLTQLNDSKLWDKVVGDLRALDSYARYLSLRIRGGDKPISGSWPRRPQLQSLLATRDYARPRLRPHVPKGPQRQRRSWAEAGAKTRGPRKAKPTR
jgi:hypothetical protein